MEQAVEMCQFHFADGQVFHVGEYTTDQLWKCLACEHFGHTGVKDVDFVCAQVNGAACAKEQADLFELRRIR